MHEQNLPTPVSGDTSQSRAPEVGMTPTGEVIDSPVTVTPSPERTSPAGDRVNQSVPAQQPVPINLPQPIVQDATTDAPSTSSTSVTPSSNPVAADDVDVIEKVWVQKAKSIVEQTKTDPYQQEEEVSKLQTDYQMKRFGEPATNE